MGRILIIGLSGYARSGKDEVAKVLVEHHGFRRVAFADKLRDVLYALNPIVLSYQETAMGTPGYDTGVRHVQDVIDQYGWDQYKEGPYGSEIRRLLQRLGTEAGRETLWDSIWVDAAFADVKQGEDIVVTDMRFPNEYDAVVARGGYTWRINRPLVGPANQHASETSLDNHSFTYHLENEGSLKDLKENVNVFYQITKSLEEK